MNYTDIHIHALCGVDDGAKTDLDMFRMVDMAYNDGARLICLTPHYHPGYFGRNQEKIQDSFALLQSREKEVHPDLALFLGNELRYSQECVSWLNDGACRTLGGTNTVLVDFSEDAKSKDIIGGLERLLNGGYQPVLAHVERYSDLRGKKHLLRELRANGVKMQLDTGSLLGLFGLRTQLWVKAILADRLADMFGSDAHDLHKRLPGIHKCHQYIERKWDHHYADLLCKDNARKIFKAADERKDIDSIYG